jgi:hypothetical protein
MTEYQVQTTHVPPVLRLVDGVLHVEVIFGSQTFRAPVGDGRYFFSQLVEKLVDPALLIAQQVKDATALSPYPAGSVTSYAVREVHHEPPDHRMPPFISPND